MAPPDPLHTSETSPIADAPVAPIIAETIPAASRSDPSAPPPGLDLPDRYLDIRQLGSGGFGEVRRVFDRKLDRVVAMKILRPDAGATPAARARFLAEIKLTAGLHHPGIIAVHDFGELADGRLWFTMSEVRGRTLRAVIDEAFAAGAEAARRRLLPPFARVCDAVAYAHSRGVIHRDLKPENVMIGEFGRVLVMDWGLARHVGAGAENADPMPADRAHADAEGLTRHGDVLGTPSYMAPEQARGETGRHGPATDVHALGAILYHLLSGRPPHARGVAAPLDAPRELVAICERAMAPEPEDRYPDAGELAADLEAFQSGARRRERALEKLAEVASRSPEIARLRARADELRAEARRLLSPVRPSDPVSAKLPGWEREDEAERLDREAALVETRWIQGVYGALAIDADLPDAHAALADHYQEKLALAERARRHEDAARFEELLRAHDRGRHAAFLSGVGALSLVTDPPGARVQLERYVLRARRLVAEPVRDLGPTPLVDVPLEKGSYRLRISAPGRIDVLHPVLIDRGERWSGGLPGSDVPYPIPLPLASEIDDDEIYVPAGPAWIGGDPDAPDSLPARLIWIDGFIAGRFPVTNAAYLAFLNALVASGREEEALLACPRANQGTMAGADDQLSYDRDARGFFRLKERDTAEIWTPRGPAVLMSWYGAVAYSRWLAARTGRPYRLLHELEREKATRGADGRLFPWGDHFDPTWAAMLSSHTGEPGRVDVIAYPLDESPYGMRGGAGNTRDFCVNTWSEEGPRIEAGRLVLEPAPVDDDYRSVRGGAWSSVENHCRAAARFVVRPDQRRSAIGLRVGRSYP